jgi:GxxExxY protein
MGSDALHKELTERIIGAAMEVHRELSNGLDEKLYENALCIEFADQEIFFEQQKRYNVFYKRRPIGNLIPDLIVENAVVRNLPTTPNHPHRFLTKTQCFQWFKSPPLFP